MSWPFGRRLVASARRGTGAPIDPHGQRLIGLTLERGEPIFAPKGSSLLLGAAGSNKTTCGPMPWLYSYAASNTGTSVLAIDSKNGELARQSADMIADLGIPVAVVDDLNTWPECRHRIKLNPFDAATSGYARVPEELIYALDKITHALIEEPADGDSRNRYFRAWPRLMIEFAVSVLLSRNPRLATPGGVAALLGDPDLLKKLATIEAEEGDASLRSLAQALLGMVGHEHWFQHLEAAQSALRQFRPGTILQDAGRGSTLGHADLIRQGYFIFLIGPQAYIQELGPYYALHLMGFLQAIYGGAGKLRVSCQSHVPCLRRRGSNAAPNLSKSPGLVSVASSRWTNRSKRCLPEFWKRRTRRSSAAMRQRWPSSNGRSLSWQNRWPNR